MIRTSSADDNANPEVNENYIARIMNIGDCVMWQIHTVYNCTKRWRLLSVILEGKIYQYWPTKVINKVAQLIRGH